MKKLLAYSWIFLLSVAPLTQNALALESVNATQSVSAGTSDTVGRLTLPSPAQPKYVPYTVYMVPLASVALSAPNSSDLTVTELVFQPRFASGTSVGPIKIDKIYLSKDGKNIASTTTLLSENTYSVKLKEAYTLSRGASVVFDVTLGQMDAQKNQQITVFLQSVWANIPVSWTPTALGLLATTSYALSSISIGQYGAATQLTAGEMKPLAPIELTSSDYRSLVVSRMSFTDAGDNNLKDAFAKPTLWDTTTNTMIAEGKITENAIVFEDLRIEIPGYSTQNYQLRANILTPKMPATFSFSLNHDNNLIARESQTDLRVPLTGQKGYRFMIGLYNTGSTTLTPVPAPIEPKSTVSKPSTTTTITTTSDTYSLPKNEQKKSAVSSIETNSQANFNVSVASRSTVSGEVSFTAKKWKNTAKKWQSATFFEWKILTKSDQTIRELVITPALFGARGIQDFQDGKLSVRINGAEIATINRLDSTIKIPVNIITSKNVPLILTITGTPKNEKQVRWAYQFAVKLAQVYSAWVPLIWDKKATGYKTTIKK